MVFANVNTFARVIEQIQSHPEAEISSNMFHVIVVPLTLCTFEDTLEQAGLAEIVKLYSFQWFPICLDTGLLSLELPNMYKSIFVNHDLGLLSVYAKSLWHLQLVAGEAKVIFSLGQHSNTVLRHLDILGGGNKLGESEFSSILLMDRNLDYPSALLTPATYAALLNEVYDVNCGVCEFKQAKPDSQYDNLFNRIPQRSPVNFPLNCTSDSIYTNIKNRYFAEVTTILHALTKSFKSEVPNSREMALDQVRKYVATQLQVDTSRKKNLTNHLAAAETIVNCLGQRFETQQEVEHNIIQNKNKSTNYAYLEEVVTTENSKLISLRLMCLMACTQKLSESETNVFMEKFFHQFGYKYGFIYNNLVQANFLTEQPEANLSSRIPRLTYSNSFYTNTNKLKQVPSDPSKINMKSPTCCSYVFGGIYIPLIAQIAAMILNCTPMSELKSKLELFGPLSIKNEKYYPTQSRSLLVYVIGGITYAEVAACNLLETLTGGKIVVCSDKVVSGNDLMESLLSLPDICK